MGALGVHKTAEAVKNKVFLPWWVLPVGGFGVVLLVLFSIWILPRRAMAMALHQPVAGINHGGAQRPETRPPAAPGSQRESSPSGGKGRVTNWVAESGIVELDGVMVEAASTHVCVVGEGWISARRAVGLGREATCSKMGVSLVFKNCQSTLRIPR